MRATPHRYRLRQFQLHERPAFDARSCLFWESGVNEIGGHHELRDDPAAAISRVPKVLRDEPLASIQDDRHSSDQMRSPVRLREHLLHERAGGWRRIETGAYQIERLPSARGEVEQLQVRSNPFGSGAVESDLERSECGFAGHEGKGNVRRSVPRAEPASVGPLWPTARSESDAVRSGERGDVGSMGAGSTRFSSGRLIDYGQ